MDIKNRDTLYHQAKKWVFEAGEIIRSKINNPLEVHTKSNPNDLVTAMDKSTEAFFITNIKNNYPEHKILSEEGYGDELDSLDGIVWIIDPIDGTMNFVHQKQNFAISIGIFNDGVGEIGLIYDVMTDTLYSAKKDEGAMKNDKPLPQLRERRLEEAILGLNHFWLCENKLVDEKMMQRLVRTVRGTRTYGSAALEFAYVAEGIVDGYLAMSLAPWDVAAGIIIAKEVGAVTTDMNGNTLNLLKRSSIISAQPSIQQKVIQDYYRMGRK